MTVRLGTTKYAIALVDEQWDVIVATFNGKGDQITGWHCPLQQREFYGLQFEITGDDPKEAYWIAKRRQADRLRQLRDAATAASQHYDRLVAARNQQG